MYSSPLNSLDYLDFRKMVLTYDIIFLKLKILMDLISRVLFWSVIKFADGKPTTRGSYGRESGTRGPRSGKSGPRGAKRKIRELSSPCSKRRSVKQRVQQVLFG